MTEYAKPEPIDLPSEPGPDDVLVAFFDRKLSWWERIKVYVLLRPDPRIRVVNR